MCLYFLTLCVHVSNQSDEQCGFANIYITNDDGSEQVFTVKHLQPLASRPACGNSKAKDQDSESVEQWGTTGHGAQAIPLPSALDMQMAGMNIGTGMSASFNSPHSLHPLPAMELFVWDAMPLCGKYKLLACTRLYTLI